jgi:hypothetical protein
LSILLIACAVLIFIALVTYDSADEANADVRISHLWGVVFGDREAQRLWDTTHNGLGLVGVMVADVLIRSTVGYSVFILPVLMVLWGWTLLRKGDARRALTLTNYSILWALLVSSAFGMIRRIFPETGPTMEWSGAIGEFVSTVLLTPRPRGRALALSWACSVGHDRDRSDVQLMAERLRTWWVKDVTVRPRGKGDSKKEKRVLN